MGEWLRQLGGDWSVHWKQFIVVEILLFIVPVGLSIWMYADAKDHGDRAAIAWAVGGILCWPITLILFLIARSQKPRQTADIATRPAVGSSGGRMPDVRPIRDQTTGRGDRRANARRAPNLQPDHR